MQRNIRRASYLVGNIDLALMMPFLMLMCIGVLMVYSASIADAYTYYGNPLYVFEREVVWVLLGFVGLAVMVRFPYQRLQSASLLLFGLALFGLLAVLTPHVGHISHGASRWFSIGGGITIEPSELAKLALVIYLASWFTAKGDAVRSFRACTVPFSVIVGLMAILIVKQPDLGTTIIVTLTGLSMYFLAGASLRHVGAIAAGAASFAWFMAHSSSYRYDRLTAFMDPWKEATGAGYHTVQVLLALGSGGILGRGLGDSIQKDVLPAPHTDSILAVIGEEWGLVGTVGVLLLFLLIAYRGLHIATHAPDNFGRLLAAGITSWITFQALMNFAVITSSVPFTGVPLPFISFGGTSLIISMAAVGILLNISRHTSRHTVARQDTPHGRGNGRTRVPRVIDHPAPTPIRSLAQQNYSRPAGSAPPRSTSAGRAVGQRARSPGVH